MTLHKEGTPSILITLAIGIGVYFATGLIPEEWGWFRYAILGIYVLLLFIILYFFRLPKREYQLSNDTILAPADGKVVVIEEVMEEEYLKTKCRQISVFMSPLNVHVNRYPLAGIVKYFKYHPGKYLVAWHPKSSTENERTTVVVEGENKRPILIRQIAGALARRIVCYAKEGDNAKQTEEMGFIKFGSRVDVFVPLEYEVKVNLDQKVKGGISVLAEVK